MTDRSHHQPVLLAETLSFLGAGPGALVVDATVGLGGHAEAILEQNGPDGRLVGLDVDETALEVARRRLSRFGERVMLVRASFRALDEVLDELGITSIEGLLMDLGVSSPQLDRSERGFRFAEATAEATPLDMRMDQRLPDSAAELLATTSAEALQSIFSRYGELPGSKRLAEAIVTTRSTAPLRTAADLLRVIEATGVGRGRRHHPATRVFQALRIAVNDELDALREGLEAGVTRLAPGGRLVVIAYHSLEDRIVKHRFRDLERGCLCPPTTPVCLCGLKPMLRRLTRRPVRAGADELRANPRARSALLRAAEKLESAA